jgi:SNF2 family DNA or RNA helicase
VDAGLFGDSFATFRSRYAHMGGFQGKQIVGFKDLEMLNKKFYMVAHRVERHKVLDLPPVMEEVIEVELCPKARALYDELEESFVTGIQGGTITTSNVLTELLRLQQLTGGAVGTDQGDLLVVDHAKEEAVKELIFNMPPEEAPVVFGKFKHDVETAGLVAESLGRVGRELSGRRKERDEWAADKVGSVLAVQIDSGGEGIDLTRARYCIYWSPGLSYLKFDQSRARTDRNGQTRPGIFYYIVAKNTVDLKVYKSLKAKERIADIILDDVKAGGIEALHGKRMG